MWERMLASLAQPRARVLTKTPRHRTEHSASESCPHSRGHPPAARAWRRGPLAPITVRTWPWMPSLAYAAATEGHPDHHARPLGTARQERGCCLNRRRQRFLSTTSGGLHKPKPKPVMISKRGAFQPRLRHSVNKRRSLLPNLGQTSVCSEAVLAWQSALHCSGTCRSTDNQHNSWRAPGDGAIAVRQDFSLCVLKAPLSQT